MDNNLVTIKYNTADGNEICLEVSIPVKELLEQSDRQIRAQRRQDRRHVKYIGFMNDSTDMTMIDPQSDIAHLLIVMERYGQLYSALNQLPEVQRRRLYLHYVHNLTHRQIADVEGVNQSAIGHSIKNAINELQKYLTD